MAADCKLLLVLEIVIAFIAVAGNATKKHGEISREMLSHSIMAPSWDFHAIGHKWQWRPDYKKEEWQALSVFVEEFKDSHREAENELIAMFGQNSVIESRLKPVSRIDQELDEDKNRTIKDIYDVVAWRVTFPTVKQILQAKERFVKDSRFTIAIVKCFGVCKKAGRFAVSGYRGVALLAEIAGKPTEIQLVTPYMTMWADWAYSALLEGDKSLLDKQEITEYAFKLAEYYYNLDKLRNNIPRCPKRLSDAKVKEGNVDMFEALGGPPTSCQFWNDLNVNTRRDFASRREVLQKAADMASSGRLAVNKKPRVIDIDKILKPEYLRDTNVKGHRRSVVHPVYYYY